MTLKRWKNYIDNNAFQIGETYIVEVLETCGGSPRKHKKRTKREILHLVDIEDKVLVGENRRRYYYRYLFLIIKAKQNTVKINPNIVKSI